MASLEDADWASNKTARKSMSVYIDYDRKSTTVSWLKKKNTCSALLTMEADTTWQQQQPKKIKKQKKIKRHNGQVY